MNWSIVDALNSVAKWRLLRHLFSHAAAHMSATELARIVGLSPMTVTRLLKELEQAHLLNVKRVGSAHICTVNTRSYAYKFIKPILQRVQNTPLPLEHLKKRILKTLPMTSVEKIVLYGSLVNGRATPESDVDVYVIIKKSDQKTLNSISKALERLDVSCLDLYSMRLDHRIVSNAEAAHLGSGFRRIIEKSVQIWPQKI